MRMKGLIISLILFSLLVLSNLAGAQSFRALMIDTSNLSNDTGTGVSVLMIRDRIQIGYGTSAVTLFSSGFDPTNTAGQYLIMDSTGTAVTSIPLTSAVTGAGGVNSGLLGAIAFYGTGPSGATIFPLDQLASSVLTADSGSSPEFSQTLPSAVQVNITMLGDLSQGLSGVTGVFTSEVTAQGEANFESGVSARGAVSAYGLASLESGVTARGGVSIFGETEIQGISGLTAFNVKNDSGASKFTILNDGTAWMDSGETFYLGSGAGFWSTGTSLYFFHVGGNVDLGDLVN